MQELRTVREGFSKKEIRGYDLVDGELKWGYIGKDKFEFLLGQKYKVCHQNPAMTIHRNAVGIYKGFRQNDGKCHAILECCGKKFSTNPAALVPWEGDITEEHLKLITPLKKMHLLKDGRCACKCDGGYYVNPPKLLLIDFMEVPENSRCTNCNHIAKKVNSEK
jgi:hypothetical protein